MLFLGAGASNAFNIPTMTTFVDEILKSLSTDSQEWKEEILTIRNRLEEKSEIRASLVALGSDVILPIVVDNLTGISFRLQRLLLVCHS